jgi:energy-coupling factor transport system substrate-specific component
MRRRPPRLPSLHDTSKERTLSDAPSAATRRPVRFTGRDLINVGIFTAIYFVVFFSFGMLGFIGPWFSGLGYFLGIIANGVVIALYLSRVPKVGALTLLGFISSLLMLLTGHPWFTLVTSTGVGLVADLIAKAGDHRNAKLNALAYAVLSGWYVGPMLPVLWDTAGYGEYVAESMGQDYADAYLTVFGAATLPWWLLGFFGVGLVGGGFGQRTLRRHFARAGVA